MAYVWARDANGELVVRFFFTSHGTGIENPATGSACANLGGWMLATGRRCRSRRRCAKAMRSRRPSRLGLRVDAERQIYVTGLVIELAHAGAVDRVRASPGFAYAYAYACA